MNRLRQMLSLPQLAFLGSALLLLSWLYSQSTAIDAENHLTFVSALRGIKQLDANLNQDVLRTRYNLLTHYDLFVRNLDQLRALAKPLSEEPLASHLKTLDPGLTKAVISLSNSAERKANLIETFKSHNAVLKNSLRYFPTAATHLISHSQRSQQVHLYQEAENLQRDVLVLNLISSQDTESDIRARLSRLRALLPALPAELAAETVSVVNHAETILRTKHEVDALTSQILMAPLPAHVDHLSQAYDNAHGQAMRRSGNYRALLYGVAIFLLGYVFYSVARIKLSALKLETANRQLRDEVSERERAQIKLTVYREIIDGANDAIALLDPQLRFEELNPAHCRLIGCDNASKLHGEPLQALLSKDESEHILRAVAKDDSFRGELVYRLASGKPRDVEMSLFALRDNGTVQHYVTIVRDISERRAHLTALEFQATHDMLTGLPNRTMLYSTVEQTLRGKQAGKVALMLLDLDRFKEINDTLGHHAGDMVLRQVANRIDAIVQHHGLLARLGGDEFAVMLPQVEHGIQALQYASRILAALRQPIELMELTIEIGGSIGIALYPEHGDNPSQLMRGADVAMYLAKSSGAGCTLYDPSLDQHTPRRLSIMTGLGQAIEQNQLLLHFQPKLNLKLGAVSGFEALVRWQHPEHGMIPPDQFIPLAEMSDLIGPLTLWVVDHALAQVKQWQVAGFNMGVAVNFSARNFLDDKLPQKMGALLNKHGVRPELFQLEITESAMMADPTRSLQIMRRIDEMGLRLVIDDFGTGHSSLAYLQRLPIHSLKIDLSFVRDMMINKENKVIVQSTIQLAHNLGLKVIAEGVEDEATLAQLRAFECDEAQGYFISRPATGKLAADWLSARRGAS